MYSVPCIMEINKEEDAEQNLKCAFEILSKVIGEDSIGEMTFEKRSEINELEDGVDIGLVGFAKSL